MRPVIHDPAPSRLSYRITRIWLTPLYRRLIRQGVPAFLLSFSVLWWLSDEGRRDALGSQFMAARHAVTDRPEFAVTMLRIEGGNAALDRAIRDQFSYEFPVSSFDLDVEGFRIAIAEIDAVKAVQLRLEPGGALHVRVEARKPALLWHRPDGVLPLDEDGHPIQPFESDIGPGLVSVTGTSADQAAGEALALYEAAGALQSHVKGFVRVGQRRWDVILASDQRILLPAEGATTALAHLVELDGRTGLLERDISHVDMRILERITIRKVQDPLLEAENEAGAEQG